MRLGRAGAAGSQSVLDRTDSLPDPGNSHVGNRLAGPSSKGMLVWVCLSKTPGAGVQISCFGLSRGGYLESDKGVSCLTIRMNQPRCLPSLTATTQMLPLWFLHLDRQGTPSPVRRRFTLTMEWQRCAGLMMGIGKSSIRGTGGGLIRFEPRRDGGGRKK